MVKTYYRHSREKLNVRTFSRMFFSNFKKRKLLIFSLIALLVILPVSYLVLENRSSVEAAWMNDNWGFRKAIAIPSHSTLETNVYVTVPTFDATDTSKFQADCGDLRFTKQNGEQLPYFVVDCDATANIHVQFDSLPAGASTYYMYYGNLSVQNGFSSADFSTAATGLGSQALAAEEKSTVPVAYWKLDEGYGNPNDSGPNALNATSNSGVWLGEDLCVSGKCLTYIHGQTTTVPYNSKFNITSNVTLNVWAKVNQQNPNTWPVLFGRTNSHIGYSIRQTKSSDKVYFEWGKGNTVCDGASGNYGSLTFTTSGVDSKWHMYTMTQDGTTIKLYFDGKLVNSTSTNATFCSDTSSTFLLGNNVYGSIDNGKVYNYVRTIAQIQADYLSKGSGTVKGTSVSMGTSVKNNDALSDGLVGYWKQDEATWSGTLDEVIDTSGNSNHGQAQGAAGGKAYPTTSKFGNGGYFDGVDDNVAVSTLTSLSNDFSASFWMKPTTLPAAYQMVFGAWQGSNSIFASVNSNEIRFRTSSSSTYDEVGTSGAGVQIGNWYHIVVTKDDSGRKIYVNGVLKGSDTSTLWTNTISSFSLGMRGSSSYPFNGTVDDFRIYNRTLSGAEISKLHSWAPGPIAHYDFEEGSGAAANDSSGNSYSGVLNGSPTWTSGQYGKGLSFADSSQDITISGMTGQLSKTLTIETWVDYQGISTGGFDRVIARGWVGDGWLLGVWDSAGTDKTFCSIAQDGVQYGVTATTITPGKYHLALTYDGTALKCYVNGVYTGENTNIPNAAFDTSSNIKIADVLTNNIKIDDVRIYNYARTSGQIVEDMNGGHPLGGSPVGSQVAYYKFDDGNGTIANNSGSGGSSVNLTFAGVTYPTWSNSGKYNKALDFNGVSGRAETASTTLQFPSGIFSLSLWVNPHTLSSAWRRGIISSETYLTNGYRLGFDNGGKPRFWTSQSGGTIDAATTNLMKINEWNHIAVTYNGTTASIYLNGVLEGSSTGTFITGNFTTRIGYLVSEYFDGLIDEVKFYNATLTSEEVKLDYNRGSAMVLGTMSDTSGLSGGSIASSSASSAYCIPGDSVSCSPPIGEWKFEEASYTNNCSTATVFDTSTNGLNLLSCPNGTGPTSKVVGKMGSAVYLDGVNDELNSTSTNLDLTGEITTQAWVKITDITNASDPEILNKSNNNAGYALEIGFSSRNPKFRIGNGTTYSVLSGTSALQNNVWYFIAGTLTAGGVQKIYVNGRQENSTTITGSLAAAVGQTFRLGVRGAGTYLNGTIDEAKIFNYARTPAQIAWDYNRGKPIGWWKMDECQGTTANDSSGNNNVATITIGATGTNTTEGTCTGSAGEAWKDGVIGKFNSGLEVDGTDDNGTIPSLSSYPFKDFTASAWVKPSSGATSRIFSQQSGATVWLMGISGSQLSYNGSDDGGLTVKGPDIVSDGQWHHVAITRDTTNTLITFYVDGKNVGTTASGPNSYVIAAALSLFRHAGSDTQYYTGQVDDLRLYNYSLTPSQIKQVYNNGAVSFAPTTGSP